MPNVSAADRRGSIERLGPLPEPPVEPIPRGPRVLVVGDSASLRFGGEAALPVHYFRVLRQRGVEAWLLCHERCREDLEARFPDDRDRLVFARDTGFHRLLNRESRVLPARVATFSLGLIARLDTQRRQRAIARRLIAEHGIEVIHQAAPVSPKEPSLLAGLGVPLVIGPMNGGIDYPPAFARAQKASVRALIAAGRAVAHLVHRVLSGKLRADALLVANPRSAAALPWGVRGRVIQIVENGVDLSLWRPAPAPAAPGRPVRFIWVGRMVDWKAVDRLLDAFARVAAEVPAVLELVGDGPERANLEAQAERLGLLRDGRVLFSGWMEQRACVARLNEADVFVLPSLMECGGAVVLEAMAVGKPVIATDWGGPPDYINNGCGILVPPTSEKSFVRGFADAMLRMARSPGLRRTMGEAGRRRVIEEFNWDAKVDAVMDVYRDAIAEHRAQAARLA